MSLKKKLKIAIVSLTSCQGCQFALIDLGHKFFSLIKKFDFKNTPLLKERPKMTSFDLAFIEGSPSIPEQNRFLRQIRRQAKMVIALGNCAAMGGIQKIKNYHDAQTIIRKVYSNPRGLPNQNIVNLNKIIKVDFTLLGCPINAKEFLQFIYSYLQGTVPSVSSQPVCYECQINEFECLLQKNQVCFGPWTRGGCAAVCLKSKQSCWGCRGLLSQINKKSIQSFFSKNKFLQDPLHLSETFGLRDELE